MHTSSTLPFPPIQVISQVSSTELFNCKAFGTALGNQMKPHLSLSKRILCISSSVACMSSVLFLLEPLRSILSPVLSSLRCLPNLKEGHGETEMPSDMAVRSRMYSLA